MWHPDPEQVTWASSGGWAREGGARWHEVQSAAGSWWSSWHFAQSTPEASSVGPSVWHCPHASSEWRAWGNVRARCGSVRPVENSTDRTWRKFRVGASEASWHREHVLDTGGRW